MCLRCLCAKGRVMKKIKSVIEVCRDAVALLIFSKSFVLFLHPSNAVSDHPHADPRRADYIFAALWNHKSFVSSPTLPKVFLTVGLKYLRGRSFLCSGKTSAPAVVTVVPLRQHSMTLFGNINIYTTHMLTRTSKYPVENVSFRNATSLLDCDFSNNKTHAVDGHERQRSLGNVGNLSV